MKIKNFLVKIMVMLVIFTPFSYKANEIKINNSKDKTAAASFIGCGGVFTQ